MMLSAGVYIIYGRVHQGAGTAEESVAFLKHGLSRKGSFFYVLKLLQ